MMMHLRPVSLFVAVLLACGQADGSRSHWAAGWLDGAAQRDTTVEAARLALSQKRPWHATELLAPVLADSTRRTPEVVLLAATAAAEWRGWREVQNLLGPEPWLDTLEGGRGRELLARAALGLGNDSAAVNHAALAVDSARDDRARGVRLTLLARALDRIDNLDSARATYERAAGVLPMAADWLRLRAAGVVADSVAREAIYATVVSAVARDRIAASEAQARERTGDIAGAIRASSALGSKLAALRLRAATTTDSVERAAVRRELVATLSPSRGADSRTATEILDSAFAPLTGAEELEVGRALASAHPARAQTGFFRAFARGLGNATDHFNYGTVLFRLDRHRDAIAAFGRVRPPDKLAGIAAYQRARSMLYAGEGDVRAALRSVARIFPTDSSAALALYLLADLATDERRDSAARDAFRDLVRRFPRHGRAPTAAFRAALITYTNGNPRLAAAELDTIVSRYGSTSEGMAARYWSGRAWAAAGDTARATQRWRDAATRDPLGYYGASAARRLGEEPWAPTVAVDSFATFEALEQGLARADLLTELGMDVEASLEYDRLSSEASESVERLLSTAAAFRDRGVTPRSISLAQQALGRGAARDGRAYRLIYPVILRDVLVEESKATGLDPSLVAALIRQESRFVPGATSPAGARGLMQVMPDVGRLLARSLNFPVWDPVLLYQADVNAKLGTRHLADLFREYDELPHILSAYNAGASRVERWRTKEGVDDPEMFTERIPYVETRDYVRIILRNRDLYRALYGWQALIP
jgi:soluble lytic murein transglycosylase